MRQRNSVFVWVGLASIVLGVSFVGGFGAFELNSWIHNRSGSAPIISFERSPVSTNVDYAPVTGPTDFTTAAAKVLPSVVSVDNFQTQSDFFSDQTQIARASTGSGVILSSDGIIVTNNHVVKDASQVRVRLADNRVFTAKVLGTDPRADLAVLKIDAKSLTAIQLGESKSLKVGQWVMAVGNPLDFDETVSVGVVSSKSRNLPTENGGLMVNAIQTDAAINPGNSGGALTDASGRLIGINSAIISPTGSSIGIGFAIPVDKVRQIAFDIVKLGHSDEGFLGVGPNPSWDGVLSDQSFRDQLAQVTGSTDVPSSGVIVPPMDNGSPYGLMNGSAAANAGIQPYDVILSINGKAVNNHYDLLKDLDGRQIGDTVVIKYWTKGTIKTANCTLTGENSLTNG